ncbi:MAG: prepilin peptidase [Bdellovibrionales bacterium]|jgi:prepilin signal peptidase PulO-like enzyme (type II secretory pathway)
MALDLQSILIILKASYPDPLWFMPLLILLVLAWVSFVDARTGRVPDGPVVGMFLVALFSLAYVSGWHVAVVPFLYAVAAVVVLRLSNQLYFKLCNHDAFGFGDAKWTALAVLGFGVKPVAWAWVFAAWLALVWMGLRKLWARFSPTYAGHCYVHFAPFLFLGLLIALVVLKTL